MSQCQSVKKKKSADQCPHKALAEHTLCAIHARAKKIVLWSPTMVADPTRIQSFIRGWLVRRLIRLAGPGALRRVNLSNEEELVSCDAKNEVSPLEYFAFEENGKIWWFRFDTLWRWCIKTLEPTNPYTRCVLSTDIRRRLREMWALRLRRQMEVPDDPESMDERRVQRWTILCQIFIDNGFTDVTPGHFLRFPKSALIASFRMIKDDVSEMNNATGRRVTGLCDYMLSSQHLALAQSVYVLTALRILIRMLILQKEPYGMVFCVMSAFFRC